MHRNYMRTIPREWRAMAKVFVALGDEHRQRILLVFERGERLTVGQIAEVSTLSRPAVSHHLKILREAGVLGREKVGARELVLDRPGAAGGRAVERPRLRAQPRLGADAMSDSSQFRLLAQRRFAPFFATQFLGALQRQRLQERAGAPGHVPRRGADVDVHPTSS